MSASKLSRKMEVGVGFKCSTLLFVNRVFYDMISCLFFDIRFFSGLKKEGENEYYEDDKDHDQVDDGAHKKPRQYMMSSEEPSAAASADSTASTVLTSTSATEVVASVPPSEVPSASGEMEIDRVD